MGMTIEEFKSMREVVRLGRNLRKLEDEAGPLVRRIAQIRNRLVVLREKLEGKQ